MTETNMFEQLHSIGIEAIQLQLRELNVDFLIA